MVVNLFDLDVDGFNLLVSHVGCVPFVGELAELSRRRRVEQDIPVMVELDREFALVSTVGHERTPDDLRRRRTTTMSEFEERESPRARTNRCTLWNDRGNDESLEVDSRFLPLERFPFPPRTLRRGVGSFLAATSRISLATSCRAFSAL